DSECTDTPLFFELCATTSLSIFFFTCTANPESYTLSLHDALPIFRPILGTKIRNLEVESWERGAGTNKSEVQRSDPKWIGAASRSEEHTSELQSPYDLVCRLLLEKKKELQPGRKPPSLPNPIARQE